MEDNRKVWFNDKLIPWREATVPILSHGFSRASAIFAIPKERESNPKAVPPISTCITKWRKLHPETVPVAAKACANYLNGYLARKDAMDRGFDMGIMLGTDGFLAEGSMESVFIAKDGMLKVPPPGTVLSGITRMSILQVAPTVGIPVVETPITAEELRSADEIFISHTGLSIRPVGRLDERVLKAPGPVTLAVIDMMEDIFNFKNERFLDWFQPLI